MQPSLNAARRTRPSLHRDPSWLLTMVIDIASLGSRPKPLRDRPRSPTRSAADEMSAVREPRESPCRHHRRDSRAMALGLPIAHGLRQVGVDLSQHSALKRETVPAIRRFARRIRPPRNPRSTQHAGPVIQDAGIGQLRMLARSHSSRIVQAILNYSSGDHIQHCQRPRGVALRAIGLYDGGPV